MTIQLICFIPTSSTVGNRSRSEKSDMGGGAHSVTVLEETGRGTEQSGTVSTGPAGGCAGVVASHSSVLRHQIQFFFPGFPLLTGGRG